MLQLSLNGVGKRYNRDWIFRNLKKDFYQGKSYAILGSNGAGKSTYIQLLAGNITPTEGELNHLIDEVPLEPDQVYQHVALAAPYLDLVTEFTLLEQISFHFSFKLLPKGIEKDELPGIMNLEREKNKPLKQFSSGMLQRAKLGLAILSDCPILLLDEPASNLDRSSIRWYLELLDSYASQKLVVICSNSRKEEYEFCQQELFIDNYR